MCSSDNTGGRLRPKSGNTLTGRRDTKKATKKEPAPAELRATNTRLERDNEAFREEVELTLEVVEGVVTRNFKQGQELEARVEGYMDVIGDELDHYELRPVELPQAVEVYDTKHGEIFSEKHDQMEEEEAFDTLASERGSPLSPASSLAPHKKTRPEKATTTSINVWDSLGLLNQDDESEGGTGTATPSPSASSSTTATSVATLSHYDLSDHHHQKGLHT
eukprot:g5865.t1